MEQITTKLKINVTEMLKLIVTKLNHDFYEISNVYLTKKQTQKYLWDKMYFRETKEYNYNRKDANFKQK